MNELDVKMQALKFEIEDTKYFVEGLDKKLKAIKNSIATREFLGEFPLEYCPECLTPLIKNDDDTVCKLCKEKIDKSFGITEARKIEQDLFLQMKESGSLLKTKEQSLQEMEANYSSQKSKLFQLQVQVNAALQDVKTIRDERIDTLNVDKGYLEGELNQLRTLLENANIYNNLIQRRTALEKELDFLNASIRSMVSEQENLRRR